MKKQLIATLLISVCCAAVVAEQTGRTRSARLPYRAEQQKKALSSWQPIMVYHGGPILAGPTNLYIVYYGSFTAKQHSILDTFLEHVGGSTPLTSPPSTTIRRASTFSMPSITIPQRTLTVMHTRWERLSAE